MWVARPGHPHFGRALGAHGWHLRSCGWRGLLGGCGSEAEIGQGNGLVTVRTGAPKAQPTCPGLTLRATLLAQQACLARGAFIDGERFRRRPCWQARRGGGPGRLPTAAIGLLPTASRAPLVLTGLQGAPAHAARCRNAAVTQQAFSGHWASLDHVPGSRAGPLSRHWPATGARCRPASYTGGHGVGVDRPWPLPASWA